MSYVLFSVLLNYREILGSCFFRNLRAKTWLNFYVIEEGAEQAPGNSQAGHYDGDLADPLDKDVKTGIGGIFKGV